MDTKKKRRLTTLGLVLAVICVTGFLLYLIWTMGLLDPWIDDVFYRDVGILPDALLKMPFGIL